MTALHKNIDQLFNNLPLTAVFLITLVIVFAGFEGGFFLAKHRSKRSTREKDSLVGPMVAAILGLLAFMLSFTFGIAANHFSTRKQLVLDEASGIRSAYAMAGMLGEASCAESRKLLREYVDIRLYAHPSSEDYKILLSRSNEIQDQLWAIAISGEMKSTGTSSSWLYVQSLSDMFNMQASRIIAGTRSQIQGSIWFVLYWLAVLGMAGMGYHSGLVGVRGFFTYPVLIVTFSLVMLLIFDLDRPKQSLFRVSQQTMRDLQQRLAEPEFMAVPPAR